jgi:hypothetical protein
MTTNDNALQELQQKLVQQTNLLKQVLSGVCCACPVSCEVHGGPALCLLWLVCKFCMHPVVTQVTQESRIAETQAKRANLTLRELESLDAAVKCYRSVGRA